MNFKTQKKRAFEVSLEGMREKRLKLESMIANGDIKHRDLIEATTSESVPKGTLAEIVFIDRKEYFIHIIFKGKIHFLLCDQFKLADRVKKRKLNIK